MKNPFFTVIITTYNRANLLKQALKSLKLQTFSDYETFIIDDGSTDETPEVFREFSKQTNWQFVHFEKNKGYPYCKNFVFKKSTGTFITFLDSDDIWIPDRLEKFFEFIQGNAGIGFIFSNGYILQDKVIIGKMFDEKRKIPTGALPSYMAISNYWLPYVTTNVAFKREAIDKIGYYLENMKFLGDTEYFARIIKYYEVGCIYKPLSVYTIHNFSLTHSWDECIKESMYALESTNPPEDIYRNLKNYIYYNQAVVFIKNGYGEKARKCLNAVKKEKNNFKITLLYAFSFTPRLALAILRFLYKKYRILKLKFFVPKDSKVIERWLNEIKK